MSRLKETALGAEPDDVWLIDEEFGRTVEIPLAAHAKEMTPVQVSMPTPPSGASEKEGNRATESPYEEVRRR